MLIDPQFVYDLYIKHNKRAITGPSKSVKCCCPLNIIAFNELGEYPVYTLGDWATPKYGYHFMRGFWMGFDGCTNNSPSEQEGYRNGVAVRNFLIEKGILTI